MRMNIKLTTMVLSVAIVACAKVPEEKPHIVGNNRDAHGCIGSAGYLWCAKTAQCERPWELAQQKGLANSAKAFDAFCDGQ